MGRMPSSAGVLGGSGDRPAPAWNLGKGGRHVRQMTSQMSAAEQQGLASLHRVEVGAQRRWGPAAAGGGVAHDKRRAAANALGLMQPELSMRRGAA